MKSKQINFFMSPVDLPTACAYLYENKCQIFKRDSTDPKHLVSYDIVLNTESIYQVYFCKEEFKSDIVYKESKDKYYIDILRSNCIEFSIGGFYPYSQTELHQSRLYFVTEYYADGNIIRKNEDFINWADNIFKTFKKRFLIKDVISSNFYVTKKFLEWMKQAGAYKSLDGTKFITA